MMKMKYFDINWIKGNLSDNEYDKREQEYNKFINNLLIKMNIPERVFANINFNDAKLVFFENINNKLSLKLYIGDLPNGSYQLNICFTKFFLSFIKTFLPIFNGYRIYIFILFCCITP